MIRKLRFGLSALREAWVLSLLLFMLYAIGSAAESYELVLPGAGAPVRFIDKTVQSNIWTNFQLRLLTSNSGRSIKVHNPLGGDSRGDAVLLAEDGIAVINWSTCIAPIIVKNLTALPAKLYVQKEET